MWLDSEMIQHLQKVVLYVLFFLQHLKLLLIFKRGFFLIHYNLRRYVEVNTLSMTSYLTCMCFLHINLPFFLSSQPQVQALERNFSIPSSRSSHYTMNSDTIGAKCNCQSFAIIILLFHWHIKTVNTFKLQWPKHSTLRILMVLLPPR